MNAEICFCEHDPCRAVAATYAGLVNWVVLVGEQKTGPCVAASLASCSDPLALAASAASCGGPPPLAASAASCAGARGDEG